MSWRVLRVSLSQMRKPISFEIDMFSTKSSSLIVFISA